MFRSLSRRAAATVLAAGLVSVFPRPAAAINLFSVQQDQQIGAQAAAQANRQLPIMRDEEVDGYVNAIVRRLAQVAPGPRFQYRAQVVDSPEINAFSLPGGYLYVNRGLIRSVRSEGELVGVIAHEMAHVAQRHGTSQASKAYGAQLGVGILGEVLGGGRGRGVGLGEQVVGSLGLNALFLKFSRGAESEADRVGAQMMARAGYDPMEMASFFDVLTAQQRSNPSAVSQFFSDHPSSQNRAATIRKLAPSLERGPAVADIGGLESVQARLGRSSQDDRYDRYSRGGYRRG